MHKRKITLIIMLAIMLTAVMCLAACMTQGSPQSADTPTTEGFGSGTVSWDDIDPTNSGGAENATETTIEQGSSESTESTEATESTQPTTKPTESVQPGSVSFEDYLKMSGDEQQAYALSFPSIGDYISWYNTEKEKYENSQAIEITGSIDLGEIAGNK